MDKEMEILKKLIANRLDGLTKSSFKGKSKDVLNKLIKDGFAKIVKVNRGERVFISEKGEIEYINKISKD
ncbi:MAG: hypothetical protein N3D74_00005, partial [Caldisericia bacterium]|nr:hypothetical protein [Caldisericia bacterium]